MNTKKISINKTIGQSFKTLHCHATCGKTITALEMLINITDRFKNDNIGLVKEKHINRYFYK